MSDWKVPITKTEIRKLRESVELGRKIIIAWKEKGEETGRAKARKRNAVIIEKYEHFALCAYMKHGNQILESVKWVQILAGDGAWLV